MIQLHDAETWAQAHWDALKKSNTVKALVTLESGAVMLFIRNVISGTQELDFDSLKLWLLLQAGIVLAFLFRHALVGIELKLNGSIDPQVVETIVGETKADILSTIAKKNPELAKIVTEHLNDVG